MTDWVVFEAQIQPMEWGKATYTIVRLPEEVTKALPKGTKRVEGEFGEFPVNLALTKAPVIDGVYVYTGKTFLRDSGLAPGDVFEARIKPADPDAVETPDDVACALRAAGHSANWAALTPGKRRSLLHLVNTAKRAETRANRIAKLISEL
ncbi:YdeI/OmpD-associated family protein [uncultured Tateyamaria sp.]|uniref:YdeI/OmpD-associated family protein n=1 Tax=Tateyamaria sp. 1078 TaxID=3417464 RepID=UPI002618210F|nr:YdeI/OmpD-associated family protein [uncultured Tateyamaria sp.]